MAMVHVPIPETSKAGPVAVAPQGVHEKLKRKPGKIAILVFGVVLIIGVVYAGSSLVHDLSGVRNTSIMPNLLLGLALLWRWHLSL